MFIAMNRFRVAKGSEAAFEQVWASRDTHLQKVPGFVEFHLLRGPEAEDYTLYASHTVWENRAVFEAWTNQRHSGPHTIRPVTTSHSISGTLSLRGSRFARLWDAARLRWRDAYLLSGVREPCQCPLSGAKRKTYARIELFRFW